MVVDVDESSKFPLCGLGQDIEKPKEEVGDKLVVIQKPREGLANKKHSSTPPLQRSYYEEMRPSFGDDGEG